MTAPASTSLDFASLSLTPAALANLKLLGYEQMTPIQAASLPIALLGKDLIAQAKTGSGKTAAFALALLSNLNARRFAVQSLVLCPTRELADQVTQEIRRLARAEENIKVVTLCGGVAMRGQIASLEHGAHVVVGTPGRIMDHLQRGNLKLDALNTLVLDEADRMLDMGFIPQVRQIVARTPRKDCRQTLLFSATYTPEIVELSSRWAMDPIMVEVASERVAADAVDQIVYLVTTADKYNLLYNLINEPKAERIMVFSNRRDQVRKLADNLHRNGISVGMLSGEVAQNQRIRTLDNFKEGKLQVLVATDVAGRGLHIDDVTHVINYTLPEEPEDYVHRIGRTGRAGAIGTSISFACEEDSFLLPDIEEQLGMKLECTHPEERLLVKAPKYERETKFKAKDGPRTGGSRPSGGSGSRSPRGR
jgi:ATP-dependent RNA helicase RhlB